MLNNVTLQGRLVADPELRHTQNGTPVASFRLAVDREYKSQTTGKREADFFNCVAWRGAADFVTKYFPKGRMALVDGRLQMTDRDGNRRYTTEVVVGSIYFCDSKQDFAPSAPSSTEWSELEDNDGELPF